MNQNIKEMILSDYEEDRILAGQIIAASDEFMLEEFHLLQNRWQYDRDVIYFNAYLEMVYTMSIDKYLKYLRGDDGNRIQRNKATNNVQE